MKLNWEKLSSSTWVGRSPKLRFARIIEYNDDFNLYFVDSTNVPYKTLGAAKIAAAKTALKVE